jgi:hypothetical protein
LQIILSAAKELARLSGSPLQKGEGLEERFRKRHPYTSLNATFFCEASIAACAAASRATGIRYGEHDT